MKKHRFISRSLSILFCCTLLLQAGCSKTGSESLTSSEESSVASENWEESSQNDNSFEDVSRVSGTSDILSGSGKASSSPAKTNPTIWNKYSPEITVNMGRATDDTIDSTLSQLNETIGNNRWLTLYKNKLGINIKYNWVVKGRDAYATKLNLSIASRQLPDICSVEALQMNQMAAAGMIEDLTSVYAQYASDFTKQTLNSAGTEVFKPATVGGRLMGLPCTVDPSVDAPMLWIRKDWLDNLNLKIPATMDELSNAIEKFTTSDPDKNGKNDTYGLSSYKGLWGTIAGLDGFFAGFNSYPRIWQDDGSGNLVYGGILSTAKTALGKLSEFYKKGYMPIDFGVYDSGALTELATSGKIGIQYGSHWNSVYPLNLSKEKDNKANWVAVALPSATGQLAKSTFTMAVSSWYVVKKGYKNPEALVKIYNAFLDTNWGSDQQWDKYFLNGSIEGVWKLSPISPNVINQNITDYKQLEAARNSNDYSKLGLSAKGIQSLLKNNNWEWNAVYGSGGSMGILAAYTDKNLFVKNKFNGAPTKTMVSKLNTLTDMQNVEYVKIIMGAAPISDFDSFVASWQKAGGDQMTKEANTWYKNNKN